MSLRSGQATTTQGEKIDASGFLNPDEAIDGIISELEKRNLAGVQGEPDITIIMYHNGTITSGGDKMLDVAAYIGFTKQQIIEDLQAVLP